MRILLAAMVPGLLALAACGSPFLSEIGPADAQDPVEASAPDHRLGARHEAGADRDDAGERREAGRRDHVAPEGGHDVVVEVDAGDAQTDVAVADVIAPPLDAGVDAPDLDAGADVVAGDDVVTVADAGAPDVAPPPVDAGTPDALADVVLTDAGTPDVEPPPVDSGTDAGSPLDAGADVSPVDSGAPDTGPVDAGVDSACITPFAYSCAGGGLVASAPYQVCVYDEYFVAYSLGPVPYACQCAATFTCGCLGYYGSTVCGGRSWSFCTDTGGGPQVTCD